MKYKKTGMCICLPNGKFNFKFSRSYPCLGKKDSKHKHNLNLIPESSEEDFPNKPVVNGNGVRKDVLHNQVQCEYVNHQGHYRQLSRDRQLPPVPDTGDCSITQGNSLRKPSFKHKNKNNDSANAANPDQSRPTAEDYGSISESETYDESKINSQFPISTPQVFKLITTDEIRDVDPLYASVIPQMKRSEINETANNFLNSDNDNFLINNLNDHGYSIIKKSTYNEFSSLRKPDRSKVLSKDHFHQSLQSLNNPAPGLPVRLYKQSELFHLMNSDKSVEPKVKMRNHKPSHDGPHSTRRFSQPPITKQGSLSAYNDITNLQDQDVLKSLQSTYNTPPIKRASLTNLCHLSRNMDSQSNFNESVSPTEDNPVIASENIATNGDEDDDVDFYRRITVRESLASLRERNALPNDPATLNFHSSSTVPMGLHHVYEGVYETLYYSSADNGRNVPPIEASRTRPPALPANNNNNNIGNGNGGGGSSNPLPYLGQDNYLAITENPLTVSFPPVPHPVVTRNRSGSLVRPANDRSSIVYTATGSDVYAEISDIYQSKQYEELPEAKQASKVERGQVNNGFIGCSSPGSVRVMLEIQSFRHMDSDVDISSRCTTPLHPFGKSIVSSNKSTALKAADSSDPHVGIIRHPWFLPQKSSLSSPSLCVTSSSSSSSPTSNKPPVVKPKIAQNSLAIMTPLMERSMEGSSMFLDESKTAQAGIDSLYDLFKRDPPPADPSHSSVLGRDLQLVKQFLQMDSSSEENNFCVASGDGGKSEEKRNLYPRFSESDSQ